MATRSMKVQNKEEAALKDETSLHEEMKDENNLTRGIVAGLLSSSCCLLQLLLNALSWFNVIHVGCAGFNKLLGPPRPYLRTITFGWLGLCWYNAPSKRRGTMLRATLVTIALMFLPDILEVWDSTHPIIRHSLMVSPSMKVQWVERQFVVHNMGCEGCQSAVRNLLELSPHIEMAQVEWESGKVSVFGASVESLDMDSLGDLLQRHGYELDCDLDDDVIDR